MTNRQTIHVDMKNPEHVPPRGTFRIKEHDSYRNPLDYVDWTEDGHA